MLNVPPADFVRCAVSKQYTNNIHRGNGRDGTGMPAIMMRSLLDVAGSTLYTIFEVQAWLSLVVRVNLLLYLFKTILVHYPVRTSIWKFCTMSAGCLLLLTAM